MKKFLNNFGPHQGFLSALVQLEVLATVSCETLAVFVFHTFLPGTGAGLDLRPVGGSEFVGLMYNKHLRS